MLLEVILASSLIPALIAFAVALAVSGSPAVALPWFLGVFVIAGLFITVIISLCQVAS